MFRQVSALVLVSSDSSISTFFSSSVSCSSFSSSFSSSSPFHAYFFLCEAWVCLCLSADESREFASGSLLFFLRSSLIFFLLNGLVSFLSPSHAKKIQSSSLLFCISLSRFSFTTSLVFFSSLLSLSSHLSFLLSPMSFSLLLMCVLLC